MIICCFTSLSRILHLYGDVRRWRDLCSALRANSLWAGRGLYRAAPSIAKTWPSVFPVSSEGPSAGPLPLSNIPGSAYRRLFSNIYRDLNFRGWRIQMGRNRQISLDWYCVQWSKEWYQFHKFGRKYKMMILHVRFFKTFSPPLEFIKKYVWWILGYIFNCKRIFFFILKVNIFFSKTLGKINPTFITILIIPFVD
jgi:hypothetical protein